jgi:hypothetical protein
MRNFISIVEGASSFVLFHGTSLENLLSIMNQGLIPQKPPGNDPWPEFDDHEPRIFATDSLSRAKEYAGSNSVPVVLRINADYMDWDEGETDWPYFFTTKPIPPEKIEAMFGGEWRSMDWVKTQRETGQKKIEETARRLDDWERRFVHRPRLLNEATIISENNELIDLCAGHIPDTDLVLLKMRYGQNKSTLARLNAAIMMARQSGHRRLVDGPRNELLDRFRDDVTREVLDEIAFVLDEYIETHLKSNEPLTIAP